MSFPSLSGIVSPTNAQTGKSSMNNSYLQSKVVTSLSEDWFSTVQFSNNAALCVPCECGCSVAAQHPPVLLHNSILELLCLVLSQGHGADGLHAPHRDCMGIGTAPLLKPQQAGCAGGIIHGSGCACHLRAAPAASGFQCIMTLPGLAYL